MKIEIDVDIPKGWEFDKYDYLYYKDQRLTMVDPWPHYFSQSENKHIIIKKKKKIVTEKYRRYIYKNSNGGYNVGILMHTNVREEDYQWIDKDWITEEIS